MSRYLTPSKLCTLVIIDIYLSEQTPTTSSVQLLDLIIKNTGTISPSQEDLSQLPNHVPSFASSLAKCPSSVPGRSILDIFYQHLWKLQSLDSLNELLNDLSALVVPPTPPSEGTPTAGWRLTHASPLGQFVRRCCVEFTRLQFADSLTLWNGFVHFRGPSRELWALRNPEAAGRLSEEEGTRTSSMAGAEEGSPSPSSLVSAGDITTLLNHSIQQLQKQGSRVPTQLKQQLQTWLQHTTHSSPAHSLHHFLSFFDSWKAGQYSLALENLHRYFDYSLAGASATKPAPGSSGAENVKVYYQYALLHLSVLHADFERWEESANSMEECVATARENQDSACLNFALSWSLYLRQAQPRHRKGAGGLSSLAALTGGGGSERDELALLRAKAKEGKHWSLMSSTLLEEAKLEMRAHGSSAKGMESIVQSAYLNTRHNLTQLGPATTLFQAASFDRLGQAQVSRRLLEGVEVVYGCQCPLGDRVRAACRLAYGLAQNGAYSKATKMLQRVRTGVQGTLKLEQRVTAFTLLSSLLQHLRQGNADAATRTLAQLTPLLAFSEPDIIYEIQTLELDLLIRHGELPAALDKLNALLSSSPAHAQQQKEDMATHLPLLLTKARIFVAANRPTKAFSIALRAASTAERCLLIPILLEGIAEVARILNALNEFSAAKELIAATLAHALEAGNTALVGRFFLAMTEANVGFAGFSCARGSAEQGQWMREALGYAERGRQAYAKLQDRKGMLACLLRKEKIARWAGDEGSAAVAGEMYLQVLAEGQV